MSEPIPYRRWLSLDEVANGYRDARNADEALAYVRATYRFLLEGDIGSEVWCRAVRVLLLAASVDTSTPDRPEIRFEARKLLARKVVTNLAPVGSPGVQVRRLDRVGPAILNELVLFYGANVEHSDLLEKDRRPIEEFLDIYWQALAGPKKPVTHITDAAAIEQAMLRGGFYLPICRNRIYRRIPDLYAEIQTAAYEDDSFPKELPWPEGLELPITPGGIGCAAKELAAETIKLIRHKRQTLDVTVLTALKICAARVHQKIGSHLKYRQVLPQLALLELLADFEYWRCSVIEVNQHLFAPRRPKKPAGGKA